MEVGRSVSSFVLVFFYQMEAVNMSFGGEDQIGGSGWKQVSMIAATLEFVQVGFICRKYF